MKEKMRKVRYPMLIVWGIFMGAAGTAGVKSSWHVIPGWLIGVIVILGIMVMLTWMISGKNDKSIKTPEKETKKLTSKYNSEISVISKAVEEPVELELQFYICHDGRELRHLRTESKEQDGYTQTFEVYGCADCSGCEHKARCLYKYDAEKDAEKNKVMKINEQWEELKERSHANIQSERGILKRQTRSIQTEGHFGDIKENENFRRFNYRSADKVYKEFMLYAIGRNINKYHRFLYEKLRKFEGKTA